MNTVWCEVCKAYIPPTRTKRDHEATSPHRKNLLKAQPPAPPQPQPERATA